MKKNRVSESDKMGVNCFQAPLQILREGYCMGSHSVECTTLQFIA